MKYKTRVQRIDALQLTDKNRAEMIDYIGKESVITYSWDTHNLRISTSDPANPRMVSVGDYVIKHTDGSYEVIGKVRFEQQYEKEGV